MKQLNLIPSLLLGLFFTGLGCHNSKVSQKMLDQQKAIYTAETDAIIASGGATLVDKDLDAITPDELSGSGKLVVAAWKSVASARDYYRAPGEMDTLDSPYLTWVVQASEYPTRGRQFHLDRLRGQRQALRLEQALGLPPTADTTKVFLILEVQAADLFRPCRDPDIADCSCSRDFPAGAYQDTTQYGPVYRGLIASTAGYPWTRMGYTLDWRKSSRNHFGFSEYILRQGAVVKVLAKTPTEAWLRSVFSE
ncbi:MAG: hypothetical protein AAGN35_12970 [Bacteroidota bacterium]